MNPCPFPLESSNSMKGYFAFPPPSAVTPPGSKTVDLTQSCAMLSKMSSHLDSHDASQPQNSGEQNEKMTETERRLRREQERALGEHSEIEWVRAGGVLRDAFGGRDKVRTERIRQELHTQDMEREKMARWGDYEARWRVMQSSTSPIAFIEFPWPVAERVSSRDLGTLTRLAVAGFLFESLTVRANMTTKKERIRVSLLRWHPDKISIVLSRVIPDDLELVREGIHIVFGILKTLQDAERTGTF